MNRVNRSPQIFSKLFITSKNVSNESYIIGKILKFQYCEMVFCFNNIPLEYFLRGYLKNTIYQVDNTKQNDESNQLVYR